jgi:hypothetical protein
MILLLIASLWSWTIIFNKWLALAPAPARDEIRKVFGPASRWTSLPTVLHCADHPMAAVFSLRCANGVGLQAARRASAVQGIKDRIDKAMSVTIMRV